MSARSTFKKAEIDAVATWAAKGVRLAMVDKPDGTRIIMAAAEVDALLPSSDLDARLDAFGSI